MKNVTLLLTAFSALFLSSCACKTGGSCCASGTGAAASMKACCAAAAAKGTTCQVCQPKTKR